MQCAKKTLKSVLQNRIVAKEALRTALVEADGVINSRPITHVSNDVGDVEALTLNHFPSNEEAEVSEREIYATKLWRQSQALVNTSFGRAQPRSICLVLQRGRSEREEKESEGRRRSACCRTEPATRNVAFG